MVLYRKLQAYNYNLFTCDILQFCRKVPTLRSCTWQTGTNISEHLRNDQGCKQQVSLKYITSQNTVILITTMRTLHLSVTSRSFMHGATSLQGNSAQVTFLCKVINLQICYSPTVTWLPQLYQYLDILQILLNYQFCKTRGTRKVWMNCKQ